MRRLAPLMLLALAVSSAGQGCTFDQYGSGEKNAGRPTEAGAGAGGGDGGAGGAGGSAGAGAGGASGAGGKGQGGASGASGAGQGGASGAGQAGASGAGQGGASGAGQAGTSGDAGAGGAGTGGAGTGGDAGQGGAGAGGDAGGAGAGHGGAGTGGDAGAGGVSGGAGSAGAGGAPCVPFTDPCDLDCDGHQRVDVVACPGGDDCCDSDADVFPGQPKWFATTSACGSFDYDCDTKETGRFGEGSKCVVCWFDCCYTAGFEGAPPPCGAPGPITGCKDWCADDGGSRVQECH